MRATDPAVTLVVILVIGVLAGILFARVAGPSCSPASLPDRPAAS